jgi:hypothetical protein
VPRFYFFQDGAFGGYHKDFVCLGEVGRVFQNLSFAYLMPICQITAQNCSKPTITCLPNTAQAGGGGHLQIQRPAQHRPRPTIFSPLCHV